MWKLSCTTWFDDEFTFTYNTIDECEQKMLRILNHVKTWKIINTETQLVFAEQEY